MLWQGSAAFNAKRTNDMGHKANNAGNMSTMCPLLRADDSAIHQGESRSVSQMIVPSFRDCFFLAYKVGVAFEYA